MTRSAPVPAWADDERLARAAWSRLAEPGDTLAGVVRDRLGAVAGLRHVLTGEALPLSVSDGLPGEPAVRRHRLYQALERWLVRRDDVQPERDVHSIERLGGRLVVPGDDEWPAGLDDLGEAAPACLWVRGALRLGPTVRRSVALVGARASTGYGDHVAGDLAAGVAERGVAVVSGAAYGIDGAAHRGALAAEGATVAVLACGVDRVYPRGHERLLARIVEVGAVVAESAPGCAPTRWRFLERNRLIAAMAGGTVVIEAGWRSGALSTASRAAGLGRPLGAVPGPVTSTMSAGCHRMLRDLDATCVTDAAEVVELVDPIGSAYAPEPEVAARPHDGLQGADLLVYESLPLRSGRPLASLTQVCGLPEAQVLGALGRLSLLGLADHTPARDGDRLWRRAGGQHGQTRLPL